MSKNDGERQSSTLPTFTSIHDQPDRSTSHAESSKASSSRSALSRLRRRGEDSTNVENGNDIVMKDSVQETASYLKQAREVDITPNGSAKRPKRASGGFLLDSSPVSSRLSRSLLSKKMRGKQKMEDDVSSVAKSRSQAIQFDGPDSSPSMRAFPLSSDIRSSPPVRHPSSQDGSVTFRDTLNGSLRSRSSRQQHQSYGRDTDPATIIDMALRLSEGRRKQASERRVVSDVPDGRRIVSMATSMPPRSSPSPRSGTLKRRQLDSNITTPQKRHRTSEPEEAIIAQPELPEEWSPEQQKNTNEDGLNISRATRNRVSRAKAYFELAYEHRRLLSHLPPIRSPNTNNNSQRPAQDSKAYNPLQYVRNRKLRFRERSLLNPEVDGWHDVPKVRTWVDAVISSHTETVHSPLECVRLPPLTLVEEEQQDGDESNTSRPPNRITKPKRPKSDWITHPGDMLADAFWTEQGLNKQKVYNRDNELIYPTGTKFQFSGWRNRTPVHVPESLIQQVSSPGVSPVQAENLVPAPPELPVFESAQKDHSWARTRSKFTSTLNKKSKRSTKKDRGIFDTSSDSSDSNDTAESKHSRGRKRLGKRKDSFNLPDGDPFALAPRRADSVCTTGSAGNNNLSKRTSRKDSTDQSNMLKYLHRNNLSLGGNQSDAEKSRSGKRRGFLANIRTDSDHERGRSSIDYDSTAPPTPAVNSFPSIAINLSPPESRSPSPSKKRTSIFAAVKHKVHGAKGIEATDFADEIRDSRRGSSERESRSKLRINAFPSSRGPSPMSRGTSPFSRHMSHVSAAEPFRAESGPRDSVVSKSSNRSAEAAPYRSHRVRGMFKGGRIAELVGNEVSRVGDYIWKREVPRKSGATDSGSSSGYESDSDDVGEDKDIQAKRLNHPDQPLTPKSASSAKSPTLSSPIAKSSPNDRPQYHIQGLPSFTSPFQRDREEQDRKAVPQSPGGTPLEDRDDSHLDPVSTGAAVSRAGRSPRFDRLAPPKLDIRAATPDGRRSSYGFGNALGLERARSASQLYNTAINKQEAARRGSKHVAGNAPLSQFSTTVDDLGRSLSRDSIFQPSNKNITMRDLARVRGLMVAIAIKATNIANVAEEIPYPQSAFVYQAFECTGASGREVDRLVPARRRDEHIVAARHLISYLETKSATFNDRLTDFTQTTTVELQREIQILGDTVDGELFPRLQALSDSAGQLAQKLTTTSTLAVKSVNDEVVAAARMRRRGPQRLGRWLGYKLIEWAVVGVLWCIWAVVTTIRLGIGTIKGIWAAFAWLFWLR